MAAVGARGENVDRAARSVVDGDVAARVGVEVHVTGIVDKGRRVVGGG